MFYGTHNSATYANVVWWQYPFKWLSNLTSKCQSLTIKEQLEKIINGLTAILGSESVLKSVMKKDLRDVRNEYETPRLTDIKDEITEIKIDTTAMIPKEDVIVSITKDGYIKRTSLRSYQASGEEQTALKEGDYLIGLYELNTLDTLLLFTKFI